MYRLRPFEPADAPDLTAMLHRAYAELGAGGLNFTAVDQTEQTTLRRADTGASWLLVDGTRIAAALTMTLPPHEPLRLLSPTAAAPGRAWLNQMAVDPADRGRGLASRLWAVARKRAHAEGASHIGVDTALPAAHLIGIYTAWGFVPRETIQWPGKTYRSTVMELPTPTPA
ncbi:GNAT family N-acetyltransferase [Actinacidiphila sp. bgisy144]|uniref:GNAT family N-acetyltransferase n=1 Tax=unclassified Actinacidiphila TaxID=2995708 RepID=UPI003EBB7B9E